MSNAALIDQVAELWQYHRVQRGVDISSENIKDFEHKHNVILPTDFCKFLTTLNGMEDGEMDNYLMNFWSLEKIEPCDYNDEPNYQVIAKNFYLFADWSIHALFYAIELLPISTSVNRICLIGGTSPIFIAQSFTEFLKIYLAGKASHY